MTPYLVFQLYGPLSSWGDVAVGERRRSLGQPSRSAVLGLVGNALGVRRDQGSLLHELDTMLGFACRVDGPGRLLTDYHTAQTGAQSDIKHLRLKSRKTVLEEVGKGAKTVLSSRDYLMDAYFRVAVWERRPACWKLSDVADALRRPASTLFLGRKSCPAALPLSPRVIDANTATQALDQAEFRLSELGLEIPSDGQLRYHWEGGESHHAALQRVTRRDVPRDRATWTFDERDESIATLEVE